MELKKSTNPRIYPNHLQLEQALKNEEILIATNYKARILQFASEGVNVFSVYPTEGGIAIIFGLSRRKRPQPRGCQVLLGCLLDPDGLAGLVQKSFYSPANSKTAVAGSRRQEDFLYPPTNRRRSTTARTISGSRTATISLNGGIKSSRPDRRT